MKIARFCKNLSQIEDWYKRWWNNIKHRRKDKLRKKYCINVKEFKTVTEELKPRIKVKTRKLKRFKARVTQNRQNELFCSNQKALYEELGG